MKFINIIIIIFLLILTSCGKDNPTGPTDLLNETSELSKSTKSIEQALLNSDVEAIKYYFLPMNLIYYKTAIEKEPEKLKGFYELFKKRKLISIDNIYAVYELEYNGIKYEITMVLDTDGIWKLRDI